MKGTANDAVRYTLGWHFVRPLGLRIQMAGVIFVHVLLALAFWFGAVQRFSSPSFNTAFDVLPQRSWAAVFAAAAITLASTWHRNNLVVVQLIAGFFVYLFWSVAFVLSAINDSHAGLTGPILWGFAALGQLAIAATLYRPRPRA